MIRWPCASIDPMLAFARNFGLIPDLLDQAVEIRLRPGTILGSVSFEFTGEKGSERISGFSHRTAADLGQTCTALSDPELACAPSLENAMLLSSRLRRASPDRSPGPC